MHNPHVHRTRQTSICIFDHDIMSEGLPFGHGIGLNEQALGNGLSGSCACVAYVDETDLYVANTGDCKAIKIRMMFEKSQ
jgi:hypothetical protein